MQNLPQERDPRSRQACEPCREKKIKCTAERPACSCCERLRRPCTYRTRVTRPVNTTKKRIRKSTNLRDKFQELQSQVQNIYGLLQPATQNQPSGTLRSPDFETQSRTRQDSIQQSVSDGDTIYIPDESLSNQATSVPDSLDIPSDFLEEAVDVYRNFIHLQPLPLFRILDLYAYLRSSPRYLLHSFLALAVSCEPQLALRCPWPNEFEEFTCSAEIEVNTFASRGEAKLEIVQSLCLRALRDILLCKPNQAQMTIGMASRLETCRSNTTAISSNSIDTDLSLRCYRSVYLLERIFSPRFCASEDVIPCSDFPEKTTVPPVLPSTRSEDYPSDLYNAYNTTTDHGIIAYYIRMASNWSHISQWLHHVRLAKGESPWLPESKYAKLVARIYECDSQLPEKHLLRNVAFSKRSPDEVSEHHEYWKPWVLMQIQCHAFLSILNHPFIHLVAVRNCSNGSQSGMFLQRTVDAALFHLGWTLRFLRLCESHLLKIHDPFVGHLVAAVGTIPWLLQFVQDPQVARQAAQDLTWCTTYLSRASNMWPHLAQKCEVFQKLQLISEGHREGSAPNIGVITFPPALLWELLDADICHMNPQRASLGQANHATMQITTHLTHPLTETQDDTADSADPTFDIQSAPLPDAGGFEQFYLDDLISNFMFQNNYGQVE